jgi:hypothetical protein
MSLEAAAAPSPAPHPDAAARPDYDPEIAKLVRAEREAARAKRRQSTIEFRPKHSVAVIDAEIILYAEVVKKHFPLWYSRTQSACFMLRDVLGKMTSLENQEQAENIVNEKIQSLRKELDRTLVDLKKIADNVSLRQERKFTNPKREVVPMYTPEAGDILHVIRLYDEVLWYAEALQIVRGIRNSEKIKIRATFRGKLTNLAREISRVWVRGKAAARRESEAREREEVIRYAERLRERESTKGAGESTEPADVAAAA